MDLFAFIEFWNLLIWRRKNLSHLLLYIFYSGPHIIFLTLQSYFYTHSFSYTVGKIPGRKDTFTIICWGRLLPENFTYWRTFSFINDLNNVCPFSPKSAKLTVYLHFSRTAQTYCSLKYLCNCPYTVLYSMVLQIRVSQSNSFLVIFLFYIFNGMKRSLEWSTARKK